MKSMLKMLLLVFTTLLLLLCQWKLVESSPFDESKFVNKTIGSYRDVVLKTIEDSETYYVDIHGTIFYFNNPIPFHQSWYDEEDIRIVKKEEVYKYKFGKTLREIRPTGHSNPRRCPCGDKSIVPLEERLPINYCFVEGDGTSEVVKVLENGRSKLNYTIVPYTTFTKNYKRHTMESIELNNCSVLIQFITSKHVAKHTCPESCKPAAFTTLSTLQIKSLANAIIDEHNSDAMPLTCSMTWKEVRRLYSTIPKSSSLDNHESIARAAEFLLEITYKRRFMECHEQNLWPIALSRSEFFPELKYTFEKRRVHGLLVTAGGKHRYWLVRDQHAILHHQNLSTPNAERDVIAGWGGTEDQYPCREDHATGCKPLYNDEQHQLYMPKTSLFVPNRDMYNCAQRRPMRALAHSLLLYDPNFIIVGDDDTFISRSVLFSTAFQRFVREHLMTHNEVYSELMLANKDVTQQGFYYGGAGYLFGRVVIEKLISNVVAGPTRASTPWSGTNRTRELSILFEAAELAATECPTCLKMPAEYLNAPPTQRYMLNITGEINHNLRLVDLCTHMMSGHNTCYNSDHAISRCLAHGSYTRLLHAPCSGHIRIGKSEYPLSMCFGHLSCYPRRVLTCHRFRVNASNPDHGSSITVPGLVTSD